jgi:hypothetical protein
LRYNLFEREDWQLFGNRQTLGQKAGVRPKLIPRLVVKELVDNALDAVGSCRFNLDTDRGDLIVVEDDGPGLPCDTDQEVADLFSIRRPLLSSKLLRMPRRGALGNGLRVIAGAVVSMGGTITVQTKGRTLVLRPERGGGTEIVSSSEWGGTGTRIGVNLNGWVDEVKDNIFVWAAEAVRLAGPSDYKGKSSPYWYDSDSFYDLLQAARNRTVQDVVGKDLDGCSGKKASAISASFLGRRAADLNEAEAEALLKEARRHADPVRPERLGRVGEREDYHSHRAKQGFFTLKPARGTCEAVIPFVVEVWARKISGPRPNPSITVCVNRTPVTAEVEVQRSSDDKSCYGAFGAGISHLIKVGRFDYEFLVNVQTPHMPITSDGKSPDLSLVRAVLLEALEEAASKAMKNQRPVGVPKEAQKDFIFRSIPEAVRKASGRGKHRYSLRQLFYALRPLFIDAFGQEPLYGTFAKAVRAYEESLGHDLEGIYRDARGVLYHPHTHEEIPLGTLAVEKYRRPAWTFNKIVYCEKEGFFPILKDAAWPERHDCALLTSKGFATSAVNDVLKYLDGTEEEITIFCVHDADGPGTVIYQSLKEGVRARAGRSVRVVNLGLEPKEGLRMKLQVEKFKPKPNKNTDKPKKVPTGRYVERKYRRWLQRRRIELNAMTTPQFLKWLDRKMTRYLNRHQLEDKLVPPPEVLQERLEQELEKATRAAVERRILEEADVDQQVQEAMAKLRPWAAAQRESIDQHVRRSLTTEPATHWSMPVLQLANSATNNPPPASSAA